MTKLIATFRTLTNAPKMYNGINKWATGNEMTSKDDTQYNSSTNLHSTDF